MHPGSIQHLGQSYRLGHLAQRVERFQWRGRDKQDIAFSVRVRYSDHCYSVDGTPPYLAGTYATRGGRLFCPIRHGYSLSLPGLIGGLFTKPTTSVGLTYESNWSIFRLEMTPPLRQGHRYYAFFRVKCSDGEPGRTSPYRLDLYVESAYERDRAIHVTSHFPFGKVAERVAKGQKL